MLGTDSATEKQKKPSQCYRHVGTSLWPLVPLSNSRWAPFKTLLIESRNPSLEGGFGVEKKRARRTKVYSSLSNDFCNEALLSPRCTSSTSSMIASDESVQGLPPSTLESVDPLRCDFWIFPIPKRARWHASHVPQFTPLLKLVFFISAVLCEFSFQLLRLALLLTFHPRWQTRLKANANPDYYASIQLYLSDYFHVAYVDVTNFSTYGFAGFAIGMVFIAPLGDMVRRRPLVLLIVFCGDYFKFVSNFVYPLIYPLS